MTNKEAIKLIRGVQAYRLYPKTDPYKALDMAIEALELQSGHLVKESGGLVKDLVKDTIDRRTAIDALNIADDKGEIRTILDAIEVLKNLPSAQPARVWTPCDIPPEHHRDVIVRGVEAIGNVTVHNIMQWDVDKWRPENYAPSITWLDWSEI